MWIAVRFILFFGTFLGLLFTIAGRWNLPFVWAFFGVYFAATLTMLATIDRELLQERIRPGPGGKDRHLRKLILPFFVAHILVAAFDLRFGWSSMAVGVQFAGVAGTLLAFALTIWAIRTNRFFSPVVRIQEERGHHLITNGPYAWIRHPGYVGSIFMIPCGALVLGSYWALLPLIPVAGLLLRRVILEDRFLHENLEGYPDYAGRVRYRLLPGLW